MRLKYTLDTVDMGEEIIAVPVGDDTEKIHGIVKLNRSGLVILDLLKNNVTIEEIVEKLDYKYDNSREELEEYVKNVIETLENAGIIED